MGPKTVIVILAAVLVSSYLFGMVFDSKQAGELANRASWVGEWLGCPGGHLCFPPCTTIFCGALIALIIFSFNNRYR